MPCFLPAPEVVREYTMSDCTCWEKGNNVYEIEASYYCHFSVEWNTSDIKCINFHKRKLLWVQPRVFSGNRLLLTFYQTYLHSIRNCNHICCTLMYNHSMLGNRLSTAAICCTRRWASQVERQVPSSRANSLLFIKSSIHVQKAADNE